MCDSSNMDNARPVGARRYPARTGRLPHRDRGSGRTVPHLRHFRRRRRRTRHDAGRSRVARHQVAPEGGPAVSQAHRPRCVVCRPRTGLPGGRRGGDADADADSSTDTKAMAARYQSRARGSNHMGASFAGVDAGCRHVSGQVETAGSLGPRAGSARAGEVGGRGWRRSARSPTCRLGLAWDGSTAESSVPRRAPVTVAK
jgi:hypothetical protein